MIASTAHLEFHVKILQEMHLKRHVAELCAKATYKIQGTDEDVFDVYAELQQNLDLSIKEVMRFDVAGVADINRALIAEQMSVIESGNPPGVITGLKRVDKVTNGWQKSDLIILAGRPGMGKTAFAVTILLQPAINDGDPVAIFSLEMSKKQLVGRIQAQITGLNVSRIIKKQLTIEEAQLLEKNTMLLNNAPIFIDDTPSLSLIELKSKARKLVREDKVKLIIIDYLQLMRSGINTNSRENEIAEISRGLKAIAKELDIPVIALAQLSRAVELRGGDKKPMLSDLRESGQIEQDADMVAFCYRPEYYGIMDYELEMTNYSADGLFMLIIAKHRNGSLGEMPLRFTKEIARVANHDNDVSDNSYTFVQIIDGKEVKQELPPKMSPNKEFESETTDPSKVKSDDTESWMNDDEDDLPF